MLMGRYLLEEMNIQLQKLDHQNFEKARELLKQKQDSYVLRAEQRIGEALDRLLGDRPRTLQRLSASFRRADLVEALLKTDEEVSP